MRPRVAPSITKTHLLVHRLVSLTESADFYFMSIGDRCNRMQASLNSEGCKLVIFHTTYTGNGFAELYPNVLPVEVIDWALQKFWYLFINWR